MSIIFKARKPLYIEIANEIRNRILNGVYQPGYQLPSEPDMADEFGVSRGTLREALSILEKEGLISRKHGIGSFVEKQTKVLAGIEKLESLVSTIRRAGLTAEDQVLRIYEGPIKPNICEKLNIEEKSNGYIIESIRLADGVPVIYCYDVLPAWLIKDPAQLQLRKKAECMVDFLSSYVETKPHNYVSTVSGVIAKKPVDEILQVTKRTPLILMEGVMYDTNGIPINYGRQYFRSDKYQFTIVRQ